MKTTYLLLFITLSAWAQPKQRIQVIPNPQSLEDFDHEYKGCPENSDCDQVMGHMLSRWKTLISNLKAAGDYSKNAQALEAFRAKYGLPVEFYATQKSSLGYKPALNSSSCKEHNPKPPGEKVLRGTSFLKGLTSKTAFVWRDQSQIELPLENNLVPQRVRVYYENGPVNYYLPINDQPLFIRKRELYVLKEEDDFYYMLKVSDKGEWKVVDVDFTQLSTWEDKRQNVACPTDSEKSHPYFNNPFCKTVWDEDSKKLVTVRMEQGCQI